MLIGRVTVVFCIRLQIDVFHGPFIFSEQRVCTPQQVDFYLSISDRNRLGGKSNSTRIVVLYFFAFIYVFFFFIILPFASYGNNKTHIYIYDIIAPIVRSRTPIETGSLPVRLTPYACEHVM